MSVRVFNTGQRVLCMVLLLSAVGGLPAHGGSQLAQQSDTLKAVIETYATMVHASYADAYQEALGLRAAAVQALVRQPSPATLEAAKHAWKQARLSYGQTEGSVVHDLALTT